jgi:NAD(P)-dependent dehydrogenase (short-subunit alcohol dehydrogenase family)
MNIVITGTSSGVGYHVALRLAESEQNTIVAISRNKEKLELLEKSLKHAKGKLITIAADINDDTSVNALAGKIKAECSVVDVLINNAGLLINKPFEFLSNDDWNSVYQTNVFGTVKLIRSMLPFLTAAFNQNRKKSHIVNISSMGGFQGSAKFKGLSAYSSSKAALVNLTECLAEEFNELGVAVNCLCLGSVQTEMFSAAFPGFTAATQVEKMAEYISGFAIEAQEFFNGKIIPVSSSTP